MKSKIVILLFVVVSTFMFSCTPSKEKQQEQIKKAETDLFNKDKTNFILDTANAMAAIHAYEAYANTIKDDSMSAEYLFRAADVYRSLKKFDKSVSAYDRIIAEYPNSHRAPYSLFLKAFMCENETNEIEKARDYYHQFLAAYPNHQLTKDVEFSLRNLGKSHEELIKQFEQMQQDTTTNIMVN